MEEVEYRQKKMDELINSFMEFCCNIENKNEGITTFILNNTKYKQYENLCNDLYFKGDYIEFISRLNDMRGIWMNNITIFNKRQKELVNGN